MTTILDKASELIYGERADSYGHFKHNAARLADLWNSYLWDPATCGRREIKDEDVPAMLVLLKVMRLAEDPEHTDSWVDIAGYAGCAGKLESIWPSEVELAKREAASIRAELDELLADQGDVFDGDTYIVNIEQEPLAPPPPDDASGSRRGDRCRVYGDLGYGVKVMTGWASVKFDKGISTWVPEEQIEWLT